MKDIFKKISSCVILFLMLITLQLNVFATDIDYECLQPAYTPSKNENYNYRDYVLDKYDINIIVHDNNSFDITETITANFNEKKHGIIRSIPLSNTVTREDGSTSRNKPRITNVSVNSVYTTSKENGNYEIKIGSPDYTISGLQTYIIKYRYILGKDHTKDYDELYYNIIGNKWDTAIGNITFSIAMPKDFDSNQIGFSSGIEGSTENDNVEYTVNGKVIIGKYNGILDEEEALTIRCELPEGYFIAKVTAFDIMNYIISFGSIICLFIAIIIWFIFGKDEKTIETVEFYPPEGFNSLEIGYLYKGEANNKDVTSLLVYLANKGYLKISEIEDKFLGVKKNYKITKLKEYDGNNDYEKMFLNGLFSGSPYHDSKLYNEITLIELYDKFYKTENRILNNINTKENKETLFDPTSLNKKIIIALLMVLIHCINSIILSLNGQNLSDAFMMNLFPTSGMLVCSIGIVNNKEPIVKLFCSIWGSLFGGVPLILFTLGLKQEPLYAFGYFWGNICIIGMVLCIKYMDKRTSYGIDILGKIKGFKTYLETAEKDKLESMVMENPTYFYDILPYAYVLDVSDKWIKKFESISLSSPGWYEGIGRFNIRTVSSVMNTANRCMSSGSSSSSSGSSGGSSGGGHSGGGSGGGGGRSW